MPLDEERLPPFEVAHLLRNLEPRLAAPFDDRLDHGCRPALGENRVRGVAFEGVLDLAVARKRIGERVEHPAHEREVLRLDERFDGMEI